MTTSLSPLDLAERPARPACPNTEQLLVWAVRRWYLHGNISREIEVGFLSLCGIAEIETALVAFNDLMATLARHGRRRMILGGPRGGFSHDERSILTLLAVHQHEDETYAAAILSWLVPAGVAERLSAYATLLAGTLTRSGHILPVPPLH